MNWLKRLLSSAVIGLAKYALLWIFAYFGLTSEWFRPYWILFRASPAWVQYLAWLVLALGVFLWLIVLLWRPLKADAPDSVPLYFCFTRQNSDGFLGGLNDCSIPLKTMRENSLSAICRFIFGQIGGVLCAPLTALFAVGVLV